MKKELFLVDLLHEAVIKAPSEKYVEIQRMNMDRRSRSAIFQHPDSEIRFENLVLGRNPVLHFETGISESVWDKFKGSVEFFISIENNEMEEVIFTSLLSPSKHPAHRGWKPYVIDLVNYSGKDITLVFRTRAINSSEYAWSAWGNPGITHELTSEARKPRQDSHPHLFILTADAMSKRYFGCYGSQEVRTPHIDRLAGESIVFDDAWSNSTTTPGSYATLWSGLHPRNHGLNSEWGAFPSGVLSMPELFNSQGYHTVMFASEAELSHEQFGFSRMFNETRAAIANPAQDGSITMRTFNSWLQNRPDRPTLCWLQFFDTHPPNQPPEEYSRMYYHDDPEKTVFKEDIVRRVFGIESMVELDRSLPWIRKGEMPGQPRQRFLETALAFQGKQATGPDLYEHLKSLPPHVRLDMPDRQFGQWLEEKVLAMEEEGTADPAFITWLERVQKELAFIQDGIISWLKNVRDFNYPVSQYKACMSYFDHLVGGFINELKEQGIYDQSTVVIVSPHGEILQYDDAVFHHHIPHPHVLSIPMIIKTAGSRYQGRIGGVTGLNDLMPTLLELHGIPFHGRIDGISRFPQIVTGEPVPNDHEVAYDLGDFLRSVIHPPYFYYRSSEDYIITPTKYGMAGEEFLYELTSDERGMKEVTGNDDVKVKLRKVLEDEGLHQK